ncbi:MAG: TIM barrel protein [Chloroflexota bacterium]
MRFCYAFRRFSDYPYLGIATDLDPTKLTDKFLKRVNNMGFDGIELGMECLERVEGGEKGLKEFEKRLSDLGTPVLAIRSGGRWGGSMVDPKTGEENIIRAKRAIKFGSILKSEVINGATCEPEKSPYIDTGSGLVSGLEFAHHGFPFSQNSSRQTTLPEYDMLAEKYQELCDEAKNYGLNISCEMHQNSPIDNSWSAKLLHSKVERDNFGINPDLGNIIWNYDIPEELTEDAIKELAPISNYWHCKNMTRVNHPENQRSVFIRENILGGEIDYRFAIEAMHNGKYKGLMALEGVPSGDQFYSDKQSLDYCKEIWNDVENNN